MVKWKSDADRLASEVTHPISRWRPAVGAVPRHLFVPRWWERCGPGAGFGVATWELHDGAADPDAWIRATYRDQALVTRVGSLHADLATPDDQPTGLPTSSAIAPGVVVRMLRHARLTDDAYVLEVGAGTGYGAAVLCERSGYRQVTTIEADEYLVKAAGRHLAGIGLHPRVTHCDPYGPLPESYDRIASMVAVRPVPASWLTALRPGGRLVTPIAGTTLILTADKTPDGGAVGRTEWDRGAFMPAVTELDGPAIQPGPFAAVREADGEQVAVGRFPVVDVAGAWDLYSVLGISVPGIQHDFAESADGQRTAWMVHPDGSWARATGTRDGPPTVHQSGPQRLWDILDGIRLGWLRDGSLPVYGAGATITPDGTIHLSHGHWQATLPAQAP
ncbi:MAG: rRNA adenine N-6-methyltransferase family protein [Streptosporangiaceae bacterium]|jgi:protein-L-isoaspartate O-methyltransferase